MHLAGRPWIDREDLDRGIAALVALDAIHAARFAPEVNRLEERLATLAADLGVRKRQLAIGDAEGEVTLAGVRRALEDEGVLPPDTALTIVGADSVHSAVRRLAAPGEATRRQQHEQLVRLRVDGDDLPQRLGPADRVRVSKLLGSIVDYRLNSNGFAEVDLFLDAREHDRARALGATPSAPVDLDEPTVRARACRASPGACSPSRGRTSTSWPRPTSRIRPGSREATPAPTRRYEASRR